MLAPARKLAHAERRTRRDPIYAAAAVDEAHCQSFGHADPEVGRVGQRARELAPLEVGLDREPREHLSPIEDDRIGRGAQARQQHRRDHERSHGATVACLVTTALLAGCQADLADLDGIFYDGDGRTVHCAIDLDTKANISTASLDGALDRARDRGQVVELYAHNPQKTVKLSVIEHVLAGARERGLPFVTYTDFAHSGGLGAGVALSFDDTSVRPWHDARPLFQQYGARVTFFISRFYAIADAERAMVRDLADDGHDIEPHTVNHVNSPQYVEEHGLAAYLKDEYQPSIDALEAEGYQVSAFAYPFGARTDELDAALRVRTPILRSVEFSYSGVVSPCPE